MTPLKLATPSRTPPKCAHIRLVGHLPNAANRHMKVPNAMRSFQEAELATWQVVEADGFHSKCFNPKPLPLAFNSAVLLSAELRLPLYFCHKVKGNQDLWHTHMRPAPSLRKTVTLYAEDDIPAQPTPINLVFWRALGEGAFWVLIIMALLSAFAWLAPRGPGFLQWLQTLQEVVGGML